MNFLSWSLILVCVCVCARLPSMRMCKRQTKRTHAAIVSCHFGIYRLFVFFSPTLDFILLWCLMLFIFIMFGQAEIWSALSILRSNREGKNVVLRLLVFVMNHIKYVWSRCVFRVRNRITLNLKINQTKNKIYLNKT